MCGAIRCAGLSDNLRRNFYSVSVCVRIVRGQEQSLANKRITYRIRERPIARLINSPVQPIGGGACSTIGINFTIWYALMVQPRTMRDHIYTPEN